MVQVPATENPLTQSQSTTQPMLGTLTVDRSVEHLKHNASSELKSAMKLLLKTHTTAQQGITIVESLVAWCTKLEVTGHGHPEIIALSPKLINYLRLFTETVPDSEPVTRLLIRSSLRVATFPNMLASPERARAVKMLMICAISRATAPAYIAFWSSQLVSSKRTLDETLAAWVEQWALSGTSKLDWEKFFNKHGPQRAVRMDSTTRSLNMTIQQEGQPKTEVETVIVWNGNGARARWNGKAELKQVVQATDPDALCFLESKTNAENLLRLPHFREWTVESKFRQVYCYWSSKDDAKGFGNEGLIFFSKIPCEVTYGIGDEELDKQARAITAEFSDCIMLFTYNPQGGFTSESLAYRTRWEAALLKYISKISLSAISRSKKMIWAGDLNVNPTAADWSRRAFDRIQHRIPKGTVPAGCRDIDQKVYRDLIHAMNGVNVAEHFGKQSFRTCFQSEDYLTKNFGQRIDHVIAESSLLTKESNLRISAFDTLIRRITQRFF